MTGLTDLLHALAICPPEQAPALALILADWLEEHQDERCGVLRVLCQRGPVEVEPLRPELIRRMDAVSDSPLPFVGYWPVNDGDCSPFCASCNYAVALGEPGVGGTWRRGHCTKCWRRFWALNVTRESAASEFLHRLRVECLCHFFDELTDKLTVTVDIRWPPLRVAIDDGSLATIRVSNLGMFKFAPGDEDTVTVNGWPFQVTQVEAEAADDLAGYAAPSDEIIRRPAYLQREDYQPPPPRGREYTATDRAAFKKRVAKRRVRKK